MSRHRGSPPEQTRASIRWSVCIAIASLIGIGVTLLFVGGGLNTKPRIPKETDKRAALRCERLLPDDDLAHLSHRTSDGVRAQLDRWEQCDPTTDGRAEGALERDLGFIAALGIAFAISCFYARRRIRWRLAADISGGIALAYVVADLREYFILHGHLDDPASISNSLHWVAAVKSGAFLAALPIVVVAVCLAIGGTPVSRVKRDLTRPGNFVVRVFRRLFAPRHGRGVKSLLRALPIQAPDPGMGIACSGGGIRSAAFSLGALQALDEYRPTAQAPSELDGARWLAGVSGGSYIAAAWVTARSRVREAWSRNSPEENHLRRHASYLAPGAGGKLWALVRFLLGFLVNVGVVTLTAAVLFLPYGWFVNAWQSPLPIRGALGLPNGGCLQLADGRLAVAVPKSKVNYVRPSKARVSPGAGFETQSEAAEDLKATVSIKKGKKDLADVSVKDGTVAAATELDDGRRASGRAAVTRKASSAPAETRSKVVTSPDKRCAVSVPIESRKDETKLSRRAEGTRLAPGTVVELPPSEQREMFTPTA